MIRRLLVLLVVLFAAVDVWLFVVHHDQKPVHADAVVVLSGSSLRLPVGIRLVRAGYAPLLVLSRNARPSALERRACAGRIAVQTICVQARPFSTRGEARLIARFARQRGWQTVDVVTSQFHVFRARRMIGRCYHGRLVLVDVPNPRGFDLAKNLVLEPIKLVYHELRRGC